MAHGGAAFVQSLSRHGLIDEYRLVILPVALGNGLPLFKDLAKPLRLDLAEAGVPRRHRQNVTRPAPRLTPSPQPRSPGSPFGQGREPVERGAEAIRRGRPGSRQPASSVSRVQS